MYLILNSWRVADCKHGFKLVLSQSAEASLLSLLRRSRPTAAPREPAQTSRFLFRLLMLDVPRIMLPGHFSWAAVFYHARFARMRVGANCFWKFRPA